LVLKALRFKAGLFVLRSGIMPVTGTAINGCDAVVLLKDATSVMRNVSGTGNNIKLDLSKDLGDFKVFGDAWRYRLECGKDASLDFDVVYSQDVDGGLDILRDWYFNGHGARTIQINLPDNSIGSDRYEMEAMLESLSIPISAEEAGPITVSATLKPNGPVLYSVVTTN
jgi:hypothetical protein